MVLGLARPGSTLVVYLYAHDRRRQRDKRVNDNLKFFVRHGLLTDSASVAFSLLVCGTDAFTIDLPASANVVVHSVAAIVGAGQMSHYKTFFDSPASFPGCATHRPCRTPHVVVDWRAHARFLLLSDVVRGPYIPPYVPAALWPHLFLSPLSDATKLVGMSISCEGCGTAPAVCSRRGAEQNARRVTKFLHVESPIVGTDAVGLPLLLRQWVPWLTTTKKDANPGSSKWREIYQNEMGMSVAMIGAGYNLASHQRYWRGHDFRDTPATSTKCALLANTSVKLIASNDRKIKPSEGGETTNLHAWYLPNGGSDCVRHCSPPNPTTVWQLYHACPSLMIFGVLACGAEGVLLRNGHARHGDDVCAPLHVAGVWARGGEGV